METPKTPTPVKTTPAPAKKRNRIALIALAAGIIFTWLADDVLELHRALVLVIAVIPLLVITTFFAFRASQDIKRLQQEVDKTPRS